MRKANISILILLLLLCAVTLASAAGLDDLTPGMSYADALDVVRAAGLTDTAESDKLIHVDTDEAYLLLTFDEQGRADWIEWTDCHEGRASLDLTVPDWSMDLDTLLAALRREGAGYDLFKSEGGASVFFDAEAFGVETVVEVFFGDGGVMDVVVIEDQDNAASLMWAAQLGAILGEPDERTGPMVNNGGLAMTKVRQTLYWQERFGCSYSLECDLTMLPTTEGDRPAVVFENDLVITIYPVGPDAERMAAPGEL